MSTFGVRPVAEKLCAVGEAWDPGRGIEATKKWLTFFRAVECSKFAAHRMLDDGTYGDMKSDLLVLQAKEQTGQRKKMIERLQAKLEKMKDIWSMVPGVIEHRGTMYAVREIVGRGSFGVVYRYTRGTRQGASKPLTFCVKVTETVDETEALELLESKGVSIPWIMLHTRAGEPKMIAMPAFDGDLRAFRHRNDGPIGIGVVLNIMGTCLHRLQEFWAHGLTYMDVKIGNLLYTACGASVEIAFGDIGSIREDDGDLATCSYPHPYHFDRESGRSAQNVQGMLWATAVLGLELLRCDVREFHWVEVASHMWNRTVTYWRLASLARQFLVQRSVPSEATEAIRFLMAASPTTGFEQAIDILDNAEKQFDDKLQ